VDEKDVRAVPWAEPVAAELGKDLDKGWTVESSSQYDRATLVGPHDVRLNVATAPEHHSPAQRDRVTVSWFVPHELRDFTRGKAEDHRMITLSASKPAFAAAKDIKRRLLPGLVEALEAIRLRKVARDEAAADRQAFLAELVTILDGTRLAHAVDRLEFGRYSDKLPNGEIRVMSGEVEVELRLTRDQTRAVAHLLAEIRARA